MDKQSIENKINDIAKYFASKQPENITFIDAEYIRLRIVYSI